jgi:Zn-dependent peptidase ImmA (M78 family)
MRSYDLSEGRSVLANLRALRPDRRLTFGEALRIAELQATRLLTLTGVEDFPVPNEIVSELPRVKVVSEPIPTSGLSFWDGQQWVITLNRLEPWTRQRFTLLHEYKHIIDHGNVDLLYPGTRGRTSTQQAEQAADFFAGCVLMPRRYLKAAYAKGLQTPAALATYFDVSERAVTVRLAQTGLTPATVRCDGPTAHSGRGYRRTTRSTTTLQGIPA